MPKTKTCLVCLEPFVLPIRGPLGQHGMLQEWKDDGFCSYACARQAEDWEAEARAESEKADEAYEDWQRWKAEGNE